MPKYLSQNPVLQTLNLRSSLKVRYQVPHDTVQHVDLHTLPFAFLDMTWEESFLTGHPANRPRWPKGFRVG